MHSKSTSSLSQTPPLTSIQSPSQPQHQQQQSRQLPLPQSNQLPRRAFITTPSKSSTNKNNSNNDLNNNSQFLSNSSLYHTQNQPANVSTTNTTSNNNTTTTNNNNNNDHTSTSSDLPDLSHLSEDERKIILAVLERQKAEEANLSINNTNNNQSVIIKLALILKI